MQITAGQIAELIGGTVEGDPSVLIHAPSKIEEGGAGTITFLGNLKYERFAYTTTASAILVTEDFKPAQAVKATLIRVPHVQTALAELFERFGGLQQPGKPTGISDQAAIHAHASLAEDVSVGAFSVIEAGAELGAGVVVYPQVYIGENVKIQANTILYPGVRIYHGCVIGKDCILHANVVIGADGFGFAPQDDGSYKKIQQLGNVVVEDEVEIGANTAIDRAVMGSTTIRKGVKLDNLIQIGHNVEIGENTVMAAQSGIAGSTKVGKQVQVGGQAGMAGHLRIADFTRIQAQAGLGKHVKEEHRDIAGTPAINFVDFIKASMVFKNLPDLNRQIHRLEKEIQELKKNSSQ